MPDVMPALDCDIVLARKGMWLSHLPELGYALEDRWCNKLDEASCEQYFLHNWYKGPGYVKLCYKSKRTRNNVFLCKGTAFFHCPMVSVPPAYPVPPSPPPPISPPSPPATPPSPPMAPPPPPSLPPVSPPSPLPPPPSTPPDKPSALPDPVPIADKPPPSPVSPRPPATPLGFGGNALTGNEEDAGQSLNAGAIAGIVLGVLGFLLVLFVAYWVHKKIQATTKAPAAALDAATLTSTYPKADEGVGVAAVEGQSSPSQRARRLQV